MPQLLAPDNQTYLVTGPWILLSPAASLTERRRQAHTEPNLSVDAALPHHGNQAPPALRWRLKGPLRTDPHSFESSNALGWKGPLEVTEPNPPAVSRDSFTQPRLLRAPSNLALNVPRAGASTTSLGNLCQCFTTLMVKNFFLLSSLNVPSLSLKPLLLVLSQQTLLKRFSPSFLQAPSGTERLQ